MNVCVKLRLRTAFTRSLSLHQVASYCARMRRKLKRKAQHVQRLRRNIKKVEMGWWLLFSFENLFTKLIWRIFSEALFLLLLEASVMGTSHKQCSHINFKCSFLEIFCTNLQWKKKSSQKMYKSKQTRTKTYQFCRTRRFPRGELFIIMCVVWATNWFSRLHIWHSGEMFVTHMCWWHIEIIWQCWILS